MVNGAEKMACNDRALCRCGIRIPSARNRCPAFDKDKYLEPMFGDVGQARTNAAILLMPIATTSSRTCTKPIVVRSFSDNNTEYFSCKSYTDLQDKNTFYKPSLYCRMTNILNFLKGLSKVLSYL